MRVLLGMSGGIDSSVAAIVLKNKGYTVIGATLRLWSETDKQQSLITPQYIIDAQKLAQKLQIEHHIIDVREDFYNSVVTYFKDEYMAGRTPNPCAKCNVVLKWKVLNDVAIEHNCSFIATGHYVNKTTINNRYYITKGLDVDKEQSFFLWGLNQELLSKALFPLGNLTKTEVREIADKNGFSTLKSKKESTGVCFLTNGKYQSFLNSVFTDSHVHPGKGDFVDLNGLKIGEHKGYPFYTVGQRRGLGLEPISPYYVTRINSEKNLVELGHRNDLYRNEMFVENYNLIDLSDFNTNVITRIRYRKQSANSRIEIINNNLLKVIFNEPEWSIAPGQTAAFYKDNILLGGGFISQLE